MANKQIQNVSHKDFFQSPAVQQKFNEVLRDKTPQFMASILSVVNNNKLLANADNASIMTAAMKAATLDLPIEPSLGYAYIVPYGRSAQFQLGYKGLIQLAQRSGQLKRLNQGVVYANQLKSYNPLFGELDIDFTEPASGEVAGYFAAFELLNGFQKVSYWTKAEVERHAKRFSKSFNNGPWKTDFDAMALKTVMKDLLSKYAPLSTDMQAAIVADNESEDMTKPPMDVTPETQPESLAEVLADQAQELPAVDLETGEIDEQPAENEPTDDGQGALFDQLADLEK